MSLDLKAGVNAAIAQARNLPANFASLERINPVLADQLEAKPLALSRTPWGILTTTAVGYLGARCGLDLDEHTAALVGALFLLAGSYVMRSITSRPIAGIFRAPAA